MSDRETFTSKGEVHYVWPLRWPDREHRNGVRCGQCAYFLAHAKPSMYYDGECTSVCCNTERGYVHRKDGKNDLRSAKSTACKWFLLPEDMPIKMEV